MACSDSGSRCFQDSIAKQKFGSRLKVPLFVILFGAGHNGTLREFGIQEVRRVVQFALGFSRLSDLEQRVQNMFQNFFVKPNWSLPLNNAGV